MEEINDLVIMSQDPWDSALLPHHQQIRDLCTG